MKRAVVLLALVAAGCGGGSMSTADYRAAAKEICRDADRESEAVKEPTRATNAAIIDYFRRLLATNEKSTDRFKELDPPGELKDAHEAAVKANEEGAAEVRRLIGELEEGGDARQVLTGAQTRLTELSRRADEAAEKLGVPECSG